MSSYCANCGASAAGASFCPACGSALQGNGNTAYSQPSAPRGGVNYSAAMWTHLGGLLAYYFGGTLLGWLPPLIIRSNARTNGDSFTEGEAIEAFNFHIQWLILNTAIAILGVITCGVGFILWLGSSILILVGGIMGSVAASKGQAYKYPMQFMRFMK